MKSSNQFTFSQVPHANIPRSRFNRSSTLKTTFDSGFLVPIYLDEVLPGDTFHLNATFFARLSTPIVPVMDNLHLDTFWFFVPNRLLWDNWQKFMGEQDNPGDSTSFVVPTLDLAAGTTFASQTLYDYMGLPTNVALPAATPLKISSLPFRAYTLIWNQWFRDENLQNSITVPKGNGPDPLNGFIMLKRGKRHDYFTSSLPWPQKGTGVNIPLGTSAPISGLYIAETAAASAATGGNTRDTLGNQVAPGVFSWPTNSAGVGIYLRDHTQSAGTPSATHYPEVFADLTNATAATINTLRQAFQLQRMQERDARGGTRYIELLKAHFGVDSPDARLQRPEFLGGGKTLFSFNPVEQNAITAGQTPIGRLAAYATSAANSGFTKSFVEHGIILGLACVYADLNYQQGLNRYWSRQTKQDFYWPALAHIGEQPVYRKELYCLGTAVNDDAVWGYQERYAEYKYKPGQITGKFRSSDPQTLDIWHLAQNFTAAPTLGDTFIKETPPINRIVAVNTEPQVLMDAYFANNTTRPIPTYSVPGLIDHF